MLLTFQYPRSGLGVLLLHHPPDGSVPRLEFQYPRSGLGVLLQYMEGKEMIGKAMVSVPSIGSRGIATVATGVFYLSSLVPFQYPRSGLGVLLQWLKASGFVQVNSSFSTLDRV